MKKLTLFRSIMLACIATLALSFSVFASNAVEFSISTPANASLQINGYTMAFASPKTYDGTPYIEITDITFADVLATDDVSATGIGTLSSPDAGTYSTVNIDHIVLKGADKEKYEGLLPTSMTDVPINITVQKAIPEFSFSCSDPDGVEFYSSTTITFTIINDFEYPEGLPEKISIATPNPHHASLISEYTALRSGNQYSIRYSADPVELNYGNTPFWAVIPFDSKNYESIESDLYSVLILEPDADYYWSGDQEWLAEVAVTGDLYYTPESFQAFLDIWESIDWNLKASQQHIVNEYHEKLLEAYNNLVPKLGDYSEIEELLKQIPDDLSIYTEETVQILEEIKSSIQWDLSYLDQDTIDQYARTLRYAIQFLELKPEFQPADYSKVKEILAKIPEDLSIYTEETVKVLEDLTSSIDWDLKANDQQTVDHYAHEIETAIAALQLRPADYTKLKEALEKIPSDLSIYTEESVKLLEKAKSAIDWDKKITEQHIVEGYIKAIESAIQGLQKKSSLQTQQPQPEASNPPAPVGKLSAETKDPTPLLLWILLLSCSAGMMVITFKRKSHTA